MRKKLLSLALALVMCLGLTVPALAADYTEAIPCKYEGVGNFSEGLAAVSVQEGTYDSSQGMYNYRWGFIDKTGKEVVPCKYIYTSNKTPGIKPEDNPHFSEGFARLCVLDESREKLSNYYGKWGFIDKTGEEVIPFKYDTAGDFSEGLAMVGVKNGIRIPTEFGITYEFDCGYIDKTGKEVIPLQYGYAYDFSEGLAAVAVKSGEKDQYGNDIYKWGYIDQTGQVVIPFLPYRAVHSFSNGLAAVEDYNLKWGYIDKTGKEVVPCIYSNAKDFSEGLAAVCQENKYGFIDQTGKVVIPFQYSGAESFSEGLATVHEYYRYSYIDKTGKVAFPAPYTASSFSEGLAPVSLGLKHGFIDKTGKEVVPCQYGWVYPVSEGMAAVAIGNNAQEFKWGFISLDGTQSTVSTVGNFTDVKTSDYFADSVAWAVEKGITAGTSATTFSPNQDCTVAQILTFLWRANGSPKPSGSNPFTDVKSGDYYAEAAVWAYEKGMVSGSTFGGNTPCTRSMAVTYMWKAAGSPNAGTSDFTDVPANADYAQAVAWAVEQGITSGTGNGQFSPNSICNRGQIVTFLYRAFAK